MSGPMRMRAALVGVLAMVVSGTATAMPAGAGSADAPATVWICHPDDPDNPCLSDLTATVVHTDGTTKVERVKPARKPPIDCFYVYPTVSGQQTTNADLTIDPEIAAIANLQASRFSEVCRVFAPAYRQITIAGLARFIGGEAAPPEAREMAYDDVANAWHEYLDTENRGRGVVLIGHSQGSGVLARLIQDEGIDAKAGLRRKVVSALLLGSAITVPKGEDVGDAFEHLPACRAPNETGCVVAYSSFGATPPADSLFGRVRGDGTDLEVMCTNPADLAGGSGVLVPYFRTTPFPGVFGALSDPPQTADTPWIQYPDLYTASCEADATTNWLQVDATDTPGDERPLVRAAIGANWGLHLVDVNVALGNLVDLVRAQSRAYQRD